MPDSPDRTGTSTDSQPAPERPDSALVYRLLLKRDAGHALSPEERAIVRAYWQPYAKGRVTACVGPAKAAAWKQIAEHQGLSLSEWVQQMVDAQMEGDPRVQELERRVLEKETELANANRMMGKFAQENGELHGRLEGIEANLIEANEALRHALGVRKE